MSITQLQQDRRLDAWTARLRAVADFAVPAEARPLLAGAWLGHALHPALTDLPAGFWTSAFVLDFAGADGARPAARRLVGLGVVSAVPTILSGLTEYLRIDDPADRRLAVVHAGGNTLATIAYLRSWQARRRGHHVIGVIFGLIGGGLASGAAYLGGHLAFGPPAVADSPRR